MKRPPILAALAGALVLAACGSSPGARASVGPNGGPDQPESGGTTRSFDLTAATATVRLDGRTDVTVWAYNGTVPGPELRVRQGDLVRVTLHNKVPEATTIHWHGVDVANGEDGVAGVTQDATPAGGSATYAFVATTPGTYWYHPHQHSADQVDKGLYGALVVEPRTARAPTPAVDQTLIVDEWPMGPTQSPAPAGDDPGMAVYGLDTVNGRTGAAVQPVSVTPGALLRLRLVNAGFLTHNLHVHGTPVRIVATDGHELADGEPTTAPIPVAAGERVDVEFTAVAGSWSLDAHDSTPAASGLRVPIVAAGATAPDPADARWHGTDTPLDLASYRSSAPSATAPSGPAKAFTLRLADMGAMAGQNGIGSTDAMPGMSGMAGMGGATSPMGGMSGMGSMGSFSINGKSFPDTGSLAVERGDVVTLSFVNQGAFVHPMHVHGHAFTPVSVDGRPWASAMLKDVVAVNPGSTVVVRFVADNPGVWMIHCHELHHAAGGMDTLLAYQGAPRLAQLSGGDGGE